MTKHPGDTVLHYLYTVERRSLREIAALVDVAPSTVRWWLQKAGVTARSISEGKKGKVPSASAIAAQVKARRRRVLPGRDGTIGYKWKSDGYVLLSCPEHYYAGKDGYVLEHRLVMEAQIGRLLAPTEDVHHVNGIRHDNRPENLELIASRAEHLREHYSSRTLDKRGRFLPKR